MLMDADQEDRLVEEVRSHFLEIHPDLGGSVPADLILAMAEEKDR
jgi:hypothetical protein